MSRRAPTSIGVYRHLTRSSEPPDYSLSPEEATELVNRGEAERFNHGRNIRLGKEFDDQGTYDQRGTSARPGPKVIEAYTAGERHARAAIKGWAPASVANG
jgi:hypothetical protein